MDGIENGSNVVILDGEDEGDEVVDPLGLDNENSGDGTGSGEEQEVVDPGAMEGLQKPKIDPRDTSPPEGSKRWKEIYGKMKSYAKELEELKKKEEERTSLIEEMKEHNRKLVKSIEGLKAGGKGTESDPVAEIGSRIEQLIGERKEALESLDYDQVNKIDVELIEAKLKLKELKDSGNGKGRGGSKSGGEVEEEVDEDREVYNQWVSENEWFTKDAVMRGAAFTVDAELINKPKWRNKPASERLAEVKRIVEERFGYEGGSGKKGGAEASRENSVEGASRVAYGSRKKGSGKVTLTKEQVKVARGLGISLDKYANQLRLTGGV